VFYQPNSVDNGGIWDKGKNLSYKDAIAAYSPAMAGTPL